MSDDDLTTEELDLHFIFHPALYMHEINSEDKLKSEVVDRFPVEDDIMI